MIMTRQKKLPPTHPGELLRDEIMPAAKLTQDTLAYLLGVSRRTVNEIVTEKRSLSADLAHRLARLFNTSRKFCLGTLRLKPLSSGICCALDYALVTQGGPLYD